MNKVVNADPYGKSMCQWFAKKFPKVIIPSGENLIDILSGLLYSTKENRLGAIPSPESQVVVREVIREAVSQNRAIPLLVPWGGRKAGSTGSIDVAEVSAILQIVELNTAIKQFHAPGLYVNIALEDTGALWMWQNEDDIQSIVDTYTDDMRKLTQILGNTRSILAIPESSVMKLDDYITASRRYNSLIYEVLLKRHLYPEDDLNAFIPYQLLKDRGWKGDFPIEQVEYYLSLYRKLYPKNTHEENFALLADYFAGAKARYDLNGKCEPKILESGKYIKMSFSPEIPGINNMHSNSIYWRTIPLSQARTHIQPWRGKGYFQIKDGGNSVKSKLCSIQDKDIISQLIPSTTTLTNGILEVHVDTPYLLLD